MLLFPHFVSASAIHGLGVFSETRIAKGETIWRLDPRFDRIVHLADLAGFPAHASGWIRSRSSYCPINRAFVFGSDGDLFMNHSTMPNMIGGGVEDGYAARDIAIGEEVTCDYRECGIYRFHFGKTANG